LPTRPHPTFSSTRTIQSIGTPGTTALKSQQENKPIFLSIGYSACHWCHVMAHESFENPQTAQLLNDNFINSKLTGKNALTWMIFICRLW
jgi:hypothetical protein